MVGKSVEATHMKTTFGPSMMNVTCQCGHTADADEFFTTRLGKRVPPGEFHCRSCRKAFKVVSVGKPIVTPSGFVIPPDRKIVEIDAML